MKTVHEVCNLAGVSARTLHYYDRIGLLKPAAVTEAGYRLYDDGSLERLQQILLFRELEFPLKEIRRILDSADFDRGKALEQQIELLTLKKEHLERLITYAREIQLKGEKYMDFTAFDTSKINEYTKQAKERWGNTEAYREYETKHDSWTEKEMTVISEEFLKIFQEFGALMDQQPESEPVQRQVKKLQDYITEHFYTCTPEILSGLGAMYAADGEFRENIDKAGGEGTAEFTAKAISIFCNC